MRPRTPPGRRGLLSFSLLLSVAVGGGGHASAAAGDLDKSFAGDGVFTRDVGSFIDAAHDVELQADGKIVTAGVLDFDVGLVRLTSGGALDKTFGGDGIVTTDLSVYQISESAAGMIIDPDGKIVVVSNVAPGPGEDQELALIRYLPNGTLDSDFDGGVVRTPVLDASVTAKGIARQSDGKLLVVGEIESDRILFARYHANGSLDDSFDGDGLRIWTPGTEFASVEDVLVQSDGRILAVGFTNAPYVVRLLSGGAFDTSFGGDGIVVPQSADASLYAVRQSAGGVLAAGEDCTTAACTPSAAPSDFALFRFTAAGAPDATWGTNGVVRTSFGNGVDRVRDLAVQPDGRIVAAGAACPYADCDENPSMNFALARYTPTGALDTSFSGDGKTTTPIDGVRGMHEAHAAAIQSDGRIVVAGTADTAQRVAVARYLGAGATSTDTTKPTSAITRPRHNLSYHQANLTSLTGTASDAGSGVARVEFALRRVFTDGRCSNWTVDQFLPGSCSDRVWNAARGTTSWSYGLPRLLTKSTGTDVGHYVLISRGIDAAGNVETTFTDGRNRSKFEVI